MPAREKAQAHAASKENKMPAQKLRMVLHGLVFVAVVLMAFIVGNQLMRDKGTAPVTPPATEVAAAPPATIPRTATPTTMSAPVELTEWTRSRQGCDIEVTGTKVHISGT